MPLPIGLGFLMLPMALPRASFLVLPMALPRAIGFSSSGGRLGQYENNKKACNQQKFNSGLRWHTC